MLKRSTVWFAVVSVLGFGLVVAGSAAAQASSPSRPLNSPALASPVSTPQPGVRLPQARPSTQQLRRGPDLLGSPSEKPVAEAKAPPVKAKVERITDPRRPNAPAVGPRTDSTSGAQAAAKSDSPAAPATPAAVVLSSGPDLVVTDIYYDTPNLVERQPYTFHFEILNQGDTTAPASSFSFYESGILWMWGDVGATEPGTGWRISGDHWAGPLQGTWEVKAVADVNNVVAEPNEANNTLIENWTWQHDGVLPHLPDLLPRDIWTTTSQLAERQPYTLSWKVDNIGTANATRGFFIDLYLGGKLVESWYDGDGLQWRYVATNGQSQFVGPLEGLWEVKLEVDASNAILEMTEGNIALESWSWVHDGNPHNLTDWQLSNGYSVHQVNTFGGFQITWGAYGRATSEYDSDAGWYGIHFHRAGGSVPDANRQGYYPFVVSWVSADGHTYRTAQDTITVRTDWIKTSLPQFPCDAYDSCGEFLSSAHIRFDRQRMQPGEAISSQSSVRVQLIGAVDPSPSTDWILSATYTIP